MLNRIVESKYKEVKAAKNRLSLEELRRQIQPGNFAFARGLQTTQWGLIAECKLASPAKGALCQKYSVPELAAIYSQNGAVALSVHTDKHFNGKIQDIKTVNQLSPLPILRKDFIVDEYQIYEARYHEADAVLLIAAILSDRQLATLQAAAAELGMDCLVEVHTVEELERVQNTPAQFIGINNRNLNTFTTDINTTLELMSQVDPARFIISESGIKDGRDALRLKKGGVKAILVGEALVIAGDIAGKTRELALLR